VTKLTNTGEQQEEAPPKLTEHRTKKALVYPFEVILSPLKAFKEIVQNPDFKGLLLVVGLVLILTASEYYIQSSKVFLGVSERQPVSPMLLTYSDCYVYVTAFGNYTFQSNQPYVMNYTFVDKTSLIEQSVFLVNATELLTPVDAVVNPLVNETFYQTTVKLNQSTTEVGNLTLTIDFYSDKGPKISALLTKTAQWDLGDFTINWFIRSPYAYLVNGTTAIDLGSKTALSLLKTDADRAELGNTASPSNWMRSILIDWSDYGNATLYGGHYTPLIDSGSWLEVVFNVNDAKIDATAVGLTYSSLLATNFYGGILPPVLIQTALLFFFNWVIYAGVLLLVMRAFSEKKGSWSPFFILVGYAFSILIIQSAAITLLIATLPEIHLNITSWPPPVRDEVTVARSFSETWGPTLANQALAYLTFPLINFIDIWLVLLSVVAVQAFSETTWGKAVMISATAFVLRFFLRLLLGI